VIEPSVCGGGAAVCQITLTSCLTFIAFLVTSVNVIQVAVIAFETGQNSCYFIVCVM